MKLNQLNPFRKKQKIRISKIAKITYIDMFDMVPIDNVLMKTIKLYEDNRYIGSYDYSDVIINELLQRNIPVRDETMEIGNFISKRIRALGEVEFQ